MKVGTVSIASSTFACVKASRVKRCAPGQIRRWFRSDTTSYTPSLEERSLYPPSAMTARDVPFPRRFPHAQEVHPITSRTDASRELREAVIQIAADVGGLGPSRLREIVCRVLRRRPRAEENWSPPNVMEEVFEHLHDTPWPKVYDIIEAIAEAIDDRDEYGRYAERNGPFVDEINAFLVENDIGWKLIEGRIEMRGDEGFESTLVGADRFGGSGLSAGRA